jgi:hypothetical protein
MREAQIPGDQVGKVFVTPCHERRRCLICECSFTPKQTADHAATMPSANKKS